MKYQHQIDAQGLLCPEPVMMLHSTVADMQAGEVVKVLASDPSTQRDIPQFCRFLGHRLLQQAEEGDVYLYWIEKA